MKFLVSILLAGFVGTCVAEDGYLKWAKRHVQEALKQQSPLIDKKGLSVVPTAEVAELIHFAVASAFYGKKRIESQRPFHSIHYKDFWVVFGSLPKGV